MKNMLSLTLLIIILTVRDPTMGSEETDDHSSSDHPKSSESHGYQHTVRCDQLPKESIDFADLIRITSFTMTHSISLDFNCTKAIYIKPVSSHVDLSAIISQGNSASYYDDIFVDCGKTVLATECITGINSTWHFYRIRLESDIDGYFCPYSCSSDGLSFKEFICLSAGNSVNPEIEKEISYIKGKVPGADAIFDARTNCLPPKCTFFP